MQALRGIASVAGHLFSGLSQASIHELIAEMQRQAAEEQAARFGTEDMPFGSPTSGGILPGEWAPQHQRTGFRFVINDEYGRPVILHFNNLPRGLTRNERVDFDPDTGNVGNTAVDQVVNTLFEQYQPSGPPPTDPNTLHDLMRHEVTVDAAIQQRAESCSVCMSDYEVGGKVIRLPCEHFYHRECIEKWLEEHNTCPVCRKEFRPAAENAQNRPLEQQRAAQAAQQQSRSPAPQRHAQPPRRSPGRRDSDVDDVELQRAIAASIAETQAAQERAAQQNRQQSRSPRPPQGQSSPPEDADLARALAASRREWEREERQRQRQREQQREERQTDLTAQMPGMGGRAISPPGRTPVREHVRNIERDESWEFVGGNQNGQTNVTPRVPTAPPMPQQRPLVSAGPVAEHPHSFADTPPAHRRLAAEAAERRVREHVAQERGKARQHLMELPETELVALLKAQGQEVTNGMRKEGMVENLLPQEGANLF